MTLPLGSLPDAMEKAKLPDAGLALNKKDVPFHCPSCEYYDNGKCGHKDPRLNGRKVDAQNCCNFFDHPGMKVIVK